MSGGGLAKSEKRIIDDVLCFDEYGFAVFSENSEFKSSDDKIHEYYKVEKDVETRLERWRNLIENWEFYENNYELKLRKLLKQSIPNNLRGCVWKKLLNSDKIAKNSKFDYQIQVKIIRQDLLTLNISEFNIGKALHILGLQFETTLKLTLSVETLIQIMLDIERTFPTHIMFMRDTAAGIEGRASLFRVLSVYAAYNNDVAYCQGMSYIAAILLLYVTEEEAFWCLVALIERPKYLHGYYLKKLEKIQIHAQVFEKILHRRMPDLCDHLSLVGLDPLIFLAPWFLTLFSFLPCWDSVLFIWDLLLFEGNSAIFRVALAIMDLLKPKIMAEPDMASLIPYVQQIPSEISRIDVLSPAISRITVEKWEISILYTTLLASFVLKEKEKEAEAKKDVKPSQQRLLKKFIPGRLLKRKEMLRSVENIPEIVISSPTVDHRTECLVSFAEFNSSTPFRLELSASPLNRTPEVEMQQLWCKNKSMKCRRSLRC